MNIMSYFQTHIGELSEGLLTRIKEAEISQTVFFEAGPELIAESPDDFVVVTYPLMLRNKGPFQLHQVRVEFVRKDLPTKRTDVKGLEAMANKWLALFPLHFGRFTLTDPYVRMKGKDELGHSSWTVQCDCMVDTTDLYITTDDGSTATQ